jgi:hypothetical protein
MREELKQYLLDHNAFSETFYASFTSIDYDHFDLENVLFYNVGNTAFTHMPIGHLVFEKVLERPNPFNGIRYPYYHKYTSIFFDKTYWLPAQLIAVWENAYCPRLTGEMKPHWIW